MMSKQPQLPLDETLNKKLTAEQKVRLNQLMADFVSLGDTDNFDYGFNQALLKNAPDEPINKQDWIDYVARLNLTNDDLPVLKVLLETDKLYFAKDLNKKLASLHVADAISQLGNETGIALLLNQLYKMEMYDDEAILELYPVWLARFGEKVIAYLLQAYDLTSDFYIKNALVETLQHLVDAKPNLSNQVVSVINKWLENFQQQEKFHNAMLISCLISAKAVDSMPLIKQAFDNDKVLLSFMGDYEEVEILMGLKKQRETPKPEHWLDEREQENIKRYSALASLLENEGIHEPTFQAKPLASALQQKNSH